MNDRFFHDWISLIGITGLSCPSVFNAREEQFRYEVFCGVGMYSEGALKIPWFEVKK